MKRGLAVLTVVSAAAIIDGNVCVLTTDALGMPLVLQMPPASVSLKVCVAVLPIT